MQEEKQARDDLLFLGKRLKGIIDLVPKLEKMDSLTHAITEREILLNDLSEKHTLATKNLSELKKRIVTFEKQHKEMLNTLDIESTKERARIEQELKEHAQHVRESISKETQRVLAKKNQTETDLREQHKQLHVIETKIKERQTKLDETRQTLKQLGDMING